MPRRLQRQRYGWSYTYGKDHRIPSEEFKQNYDQIEWGDLDIHDWPTKQTRFGKARVKIFADDLAD